MCHLSLLFMLCLLLQVTGALLTLFTRSLCVLINTVILNAFILRFFCEIGGGGDDELSLRFIVLLLHGLSCDFIVMWGDDELSLRFLLFPRHEL